MQTNQNSYERLAVSMRYRILFSFDCIARRARRPDSRGNPLIRFKKIIEISYFNEIEY